MFVLPGTSEHNVWRLGTAVTKKVGTAVVRNRIKRLVREFFRLHQNKIQIPMDIVVVPKRRIDAKHLNLEAVKKELLPLLALCARRGIHNNGPRNLKTWKK